MCEKTAVLTIVSLFIFSAVPYAVTADGYCFLENQSQHLGTKVLFQADTPTAITDSTYTDSSGYYQLDVHAGGYDVYFSHAGYYDEVLENQACFSNTTLRDVTLMEAPEMRLSGELYGVLHGTTYLIVGDIVVNQYDSLTIEPGATFFFHGNFRFYVEGYLLAAGTEQDSIRFVLSPYATEWGGIFFNDSSQDSCRLEYVLISGCSSQAIDVFRSNPIIRHSVMTGNCLTSDNGGAGIRLLGSGARVEYCTISHNSTESGNGGGMYIGESGSPTIRECNISYNIVPTGASGGGIYCTDGATPTISYCSITDNTADEDGGGICCSGSDAVIDHCEIRQNDSDGAGGGIFCGFGSPIIRHCAITHNMGGWGGGGISCDESSSLIVEYCTIQYNSGLGGGIFFGGFSQGFVSQCIFNGNSGWAGGGIHCYQSSPTIEYCVIYGNNASDWGGGINIQFQAAPTISHCTVYGNTAVDHGSGISIVRAYPHIVHTIVAYNLAAGGVYFSYDSSSTSILSYCDFYSNGGGNFTGESSAIPPGLGQIVGFNGNGDPRDTYWNIFLDPLFISPSAGNFFLQAASPCIDAGNPEAAHDPDGTITDIGAYYFDQGTPDILILTPELDFGSVVIGDEAALVLTIYNVGNGRLMLRDVYASDSCFTTNFDPLDSLIAPYDSLNITVTFSPSDSITYDAVLTVENNDEPTEIALRGEGVPPTRATSEPILKLPTSFALGDPYPNPFNSTLAIPFTLPAQSEVKITIYNILGQKAYQFALPPLSPGSHVVSWSPDASASGIYFVHLSAGSHQFARKVLLLK